MKTGVALFAVDGDWQRTSGRAVTTSSGLESSQHRLHGDHVGHSSRGRFYPLCPNGPLLQVSGGTQKPLPLSQVSWVSSCSSTFPSPHTFLLSNKPKNFRYEPIFLDNIITTTRATKQTLCLLLGFFVFFLAYSSFWLFRLSLFHHPLWLRVSAYSSSSSVSTSSFIILQLIQSTIHYQFIHFCCIIIPIVIQNAAIFFSFYFQPDEFQPTECYVNDWHRRKWKKETTHTSTSEDPRANHPPFNKEFSTKTKIKPTNQHINEPTKCPFMISSFSPVGQHILYLLPFYVSSAFVLVCLLITQKPTKQNSEPSISKKKF